MSRHVALSFRCVEYENDGNTKRFEVTFEGWGGWANIQFHNKPPPREIIEQLAHLSKVLNDLSAWVNPEEKP